MATPPKVLIKRTATPNSPPTGLLPGELAIEMDTPTRLWVGVPPAQDPSEKKLLADPSSAMSDAPSDTNAYGRMGGAWTQVLPLAGGTLTGFLTLHANPTVAMQAATKQYVDGAIAGAGGGDMSTAGNQTLTGGFNFTPFSIGNIPASFTPNPMMGNYQHGINNAAFTFNVPASDCAIDIMITNSATAGAITFTGFTVAAANTGDTYVTTSGYRFIVSLRRINNVSTYVIKALQ